jgi:hypothetical protein
MMKGIIRESPKVMKGIVQEVLPKVLVLDREEVRETDMNPDAVLLFVLKRGSEIIMSLLVGVRIETG